ncbi:hypothetical protein FS749_003327 [Ceratobasidium sp. UAMH 11750]|nr:hypothetical protein FS749_003327 [Ceratobasidium sp. UAMH 11750]
MSQSQRGKARVPPSPNFDLNDYDFDAVDHPASQNALLSPTIHGDMEAAGEEIDPEFEEWVARTATVVTRDRKRLSDLTRDDLENLCYHLSCSLFYAVRDGLYPGVYLGWIAARRQAANWMPNGPFNGGSLCRFDNAVDAWNFVCTRDKCHGQYAPDSVSMLQSLPPPAGYFLPPPMMLNQQGTLVELAPRLNRTFPIPSAPLSLRTGDNARLDENPRGVCLSDREHYHAIGTRIERCYATPATALDPNSPSFSTPITVKQALAGSPPTYPALDMSSSDMPASPTPLTANRRTSSQLSPPRSQGVRKQLTSSQPSTSYRSPTRPVGLSQTMNSRLSSMQASTSRAGYSQASSSSINSSQASDSQPDSVSIPKHSKSKQRLLRRQSPHAPRKKVSNVGHITALAAAMAARQRQTDLSASISQLQTLMDGLIKSTAIKFTVKECVVRSQLYRSNNHAEKKRGPSLWNGFLWTIADEANEGRQVGEKAKINSLVTDEVRERYRNLSDEERAEILAKHREYRDANSKGRYITDKSDHHAAMSKIKSVNKTLHSLYEQHDAHFLLIVVRGSPTSYLKPQIISTTEADKFWTLSGIQDVHAWATRLEAFCTGGILDLLSKDAQSGSHIRGQIRTLLGQKLVSITGDVKATMSYAKYERDIVDKYNVVLEGWPFSTIRNLADERASNSELAQLYQRLLNGGCYFRELTQEEIDERSARDVSAADSTRKLRAPRSDKGVKRGPQRARLTRQATGGDSVGASGTPNVQPHSALA